MAGNLPVPNGLEVKLVWQLDGADTALNILHFTHTVGAAHSQARADTISNAYKTAFTASAHNAAISTRVGLARVESRHMDSNTDPWFIGAGAAVLGTSADNVLPAATCLCISLRTGLRGRSFNGRCYLWGFTEGANDVAGGATQAAADNAATFLFSAAQTIETGLGGEWALLSRWTTLPTAPPGTPPTERNPPILTPIISSPARDRRWDVQRRRAVPGI